MRTAMLTAMALAVAVLLCGPARAATVSVDKLIVVIGEADASYAADVLNALAAHSVDINMQFVVTDPDTAYIFDMNDSVNAPADNKILQVTFGTVDGGLPQKASDTLVVKELEGVPVGIEMLITNPDPAELTTLLNTVDPDSVEARFIIIDPDPEDAELVIAAAGPSSGEVYINFLFTNPDPLSLIGALLVTGTLPENMRFTTTLSLAF